MRETKPEKKMMKKNEDISCAPASMSERVNVEGNQPFFRFSQLLCQHEKMSNLIFLLIIKLRQRQIKNS